jgi:hypothetical protein
MSTSLAITLGIALLVGVLLVIFNDGTEKKEKKMDY